MKNDILTISSTLNIRKQANLNAEIIITLEEFDTIQIIERVNNDWCFVYIPLKEIYGYAYINAIK